MARPYLLLVATLALLSPCEALAGGWAMLSDHSQLAGYAIAEVGEVEENSKFTEDFERIEWFEFNGKCFLSSNSYAIGGLGPEAALLLVDADKNIRLAVFKTTIAAVNVEVQAVTWINCPSPF